MAELFPQNILLRVGPKMLDRFGSLAVLGPGRGRAAPLPYTFTRADATTCASYFDRSGLLRTAVAGVPRLGDFGPFYEQGLVDALGNPLFGIRLEGTRTNVVLWNRDLTNAAWVKTNVTAVKDQTGLDGVASSASRITASAGNGTCLQAITLGSSSRFQTAWVKRLVGAGTINMTMDNGATWTPIAVQAAWTRVNISTQTLANPTAGFQIVTNGDSVAIDLVQNENGNYPTTSLATTTAAVTRAADSLTLPWNLGPMDLTLFARVARPVHADTSGALPQHPAIASIGLTAPYVFLHFRSDARQLTAGINSGGFGTAASQSIPAGADLKMVAQWRTLTTAPRYKLDVGGGFGGEIQSGAACTLFGDQTVAVGKGAFGEPMQGVLLDLILARGLFSLAELAAVP